jgi:fructose-1,6-bisphosphatase/inositol monophosphatase family enzyme
MTDSLPMPVTAPLTRAQRTQLVTLIRRTARAEIMPRFRQLTAEQIGTKSGPQDIVTEADRAAEAMLSRGLQAMFPNALIVGEEHASDNPEILDRIAGAELAFTIDPVDGTWNYARGLAVFGVMVGIVRFGTPVAGFLYDPLANDVFHADIETPARMLLPSGADRALRVSQGGPVERLTGHVPLFVFPKSVQPRVAATFPRFDRIGMLRCVCHEFRLLVQGHVDFVLCAKLTPWDHAPGTILARRAGAHVAMLDGSEYRADMREGVMLAACNPETWGRVRDVFDFLIDTPVDPAA